MSSFEDSKSRVLRAWPDAHAWKSNFYPPEIWVVNQSTKDNNPEVGHGKTEDDAWDAASMTLSFYERGVKDGVAQAKEAKS